MAKIGVIGDRDSVLLFQAVGLDVFFEDDGERANRTLHRLAREGYVALFVTEKLYPACAETIQEYQASAFPAIVPIPDNQGSRGVGAEALRKNVEKAVGMDILSNS
jgi:V/A-type H+/Na+-transporting ATPase subunit F